MHLSLDKLTSIDIESVLDAVGRRRGRLVDRRLRAHFGATKGRLAVDGIAAVNGIELWFEEFGNPADPAVLLIMGAGGLGIGWPDQFCEMLA